VLPDLAETELVASPPHEGPGAWAGGPSALVHEGMTYLAYRLRRPVGEGRGFSNVLAMSPDGVHFERVAVVPRDRFDTDSLERPALVRTPEGRWRLYVSLATPGTKHWRVELLEADRIGALATAPAVTVLPGSDHEAVKDPVVVHDGDRWHLWACVHPLESWDDADRMSTHYATSADGLDWTWHGAVLTGRPGAWDARGARVTSVRIDGDQLLATYDGRASAEQNWEEVTGFATAHRRADGLFGPLTPHPGDPHRSPWGSGGLRYLARVPVEGGTRWYLEVARPDDSHELRTGITTP